MLIAREDACKFQDWASDQFSTWLRRVLSPNHKFNLEKDLVPFVPTLPILDQVGVLYDFLPENKQVAFRLGLVSAIMDLSPSSESLKIFEELTHLAGIIEADGAIAALIAKTKEPEFLSHLSPKGADELFALVFNVVAGMAKTQEDGRLLESLTDSRRYKPEYNAMLNDTLERVYV